METNLRRSGGMELATEKVCCLLVYFFFWFFFFAFLDSEKIKKIMWERKKKKKYIFNFLSCISSEKKENLQNIIIPFSHFLISFVDKWLWKVCLSKLISFSHNLKKQKCKNNALSSHFCSLFHNPNWQKYWRSHNLLLTFLLIS